MKDERKTKAELLEELAGLRKRIEELEGVASSGPAAGHPYTEEGGERFHYILDCLPLFAFLLTPDYKIWYANRYFRKVYGEPGDRFCYEVIYGRTKPCEACHPFEVFKTGRSSVWEARNPDDGRTYKVYDYPFTDTDGSRLALEIRVDLTDIRRAEEAKRASEARYSMVHATAFDGIIIADKEGMVLECNPSAEKIFGYGHGELVGRELTDLIPEEYRERHLRGIRRHLMGDKNKVQRKVMELKAMRKDGSVFPNELVIGSFTLDGETFFTGTVRDITERKLAEEKQADQLSFLKTLMDTIPSPIFYKDMDGRYLGCNKAFEECIGFTDKGLAGKTVYDVAPKELADKYFRMDSALFESPGVQVYEASVKFKDGSIHDVIFNKATFSEKGELAGLVGVITDITERKRAEEALAESEARWRTISDNSSDFLMITDTKGVMKYINRTMPGYSKEKALGRPITDWLPSECVPEVKACLDRVARSGKPDRYETEFVDLDGTFKYFESRVGPLFRDGKVTALTINATDMTERKRAEEEKERLQAQLVQSQKMEAIGTLAGGVAHDFNNIITVVKTLTDLALSKIDENDRFYKYLKPVSESSSRAINLVQQLLLFSRNRPVEFESLDLNDTVTNLLGMFEHLISEDILIESALAYNTPKVRADKGRMEQLITNLVINASDAMPHGGSIVIRTECVTLGSKDCKELPMASPGKFVCLTVEDSGSGMDKEVMEHIFEPFFSSKSTAGTGMGLAVVYGIVKDHRGWINVTSEPGEGSSFKVYLPDVSEEKEEEVQETPPAKYGNGAGRRILLVEDEKWVRKSTAMVLTEYGYKVFEAANAENAIGLFYREKGRFDLVLSDVVMPGRDGLQLVSPLLDINPKIPILLCSAHLDDKAQLSQIVKRGLAYIHKPYEIPELLAAIEETIRDNT